METTEPDIVSIMRWCAASSRESLAPADALSFYEHMRGVARAILPSESHTLQPTAVLHEALIRLKSSEDLAVRNENHFFCLAAKAMRYVIADHARAGGAQKRGGGWDRVTLGAVWDTGGESFDRLELTEALDRLEELSPRQVRVVELRFFVGLTTERIAEVLGVAERTVRNDWRVARAWLRARLLTEPEA